MKPNSIAIFNSNDEVPSNGDALYRFQQNSDLYWLCGIEQEDTMIILFPDFPDPKYKEVLILVRPNEQKEKWDGKRLGRKSEIWKLRCLSSERHQKIIKGILFPCLYIYGNHIQYS